MNTEPSEVERLQRIEAAAHAFSVWQASPVEQVPAIELGDWRVMQLENGNRHLVGTNLSKDTGRVSSLVVSFDAVQASAVTDSGRVYRLVGPPGTSGDSNYVWSRFLQQMGSPAWTDVTSAVLADISSAQASDKP